MARTKRSARLGSREGRSKLDRGKRYQEQLSEGRYLAYRRPMNGAAGSWMARWTDLTTGDSRQQRLGVADDLMDPDGVNILDFGTAQKKAQEWFELKNNQASIEATGAPVKGGPCSVKSVAEAYLLDAAKRGVKGHSIMSTTFKAHILPELGNIEIAKLTKGRIEKWLHTLAESPRRKTGTAKEKVEHLPPPSTEDEKRARKDSANRVLTNLKAALNFAVKEKLYAGPSPWLDVKKFKGVSAARVRFLDVNEQRRLVNACPDGFKQLVQAALFSGCRYGELGRLKVRDFDAAASTLFIEKSKSGKPRYIALTQEAADWFTEQVAGRHSGDSLLVKPNSKGKVRKYQEDPLAWGPHDQKKLMAEACTAAKIEPLGFHELRHTYASGLVNAGVPLAFVAAQLGHVDTSMVEKHYGHLCKSALAESIRKLAPELRIASPRSKNLKI